MTDWSTGKPVKQPSNHPNNQPNNSEEQSPLEKLIVTEPLKRFNAFMETKSSISYIYIGSSQNVVLSQFNPVYIFTIDLNSNLILSSDLYLGLPSSSFSSDFLIII